MRGLRKLRGVSVKGFCAVADVVIGGLVGYYGSTDYLSWEDAEKIEGCFRKEFNCRFGRAHSSARLPLYVPYMGRKPLRTHAHATAAAALYETVTAAASDEQDTVVRRAARSAIARAMQVWGCAQDPLTWQWSGQKEALQASLKRSRVKQLGEAWMLAAVVSNEHARAMDKADMMDKGQVRAVWEGGTGRLQIVGQDERVDALTCGEDWWAGVSGLQDGWTGRTAEEKRRSAVLRKSTVRLHALARQLNHPGERSAAQWATALERAVGACR